MPHELPNDLRLKTGRVQNNVKTSCDYNLVPSLLFHMETRVFLKYFVRGCSKMLVRLSVVFCERLQPQNVIFLFSIKYWYLLTAKTTDINDFYME